MIRSNHRRPRRCGARPLTPIQRSVRFAIVMTRAHLGRRHRGNLCPIDAPSLLCAWALPTHYSSPTLPTFHRLRQRQPIAPANGIAAALQEGTGRAIPKTTVWRTRETSHRSAIAETEKNDELGGLNRLECALTFKLPSELPASIAWTGTLESFATSRVIVRESSDSRRLRRASPIFKTVTVLSRSVIATFSAKRRSLAAVANSRTESVAGPSFARHHRMFCRVPSGSGYRYKVRKAIFDWPDHSEILIVLSSALVAHSIRFERGKQQRSTDHISLPCKPCWRTGGKDKSRLCKHS